MKPKRKTILAGGGFSIRRRTRVRDPAHRGHNYEIELIDYLRRQGLKNPVLKGQPRLKAKLVNRKVGRLGKKERRRVRLAHRHVGKSKDRLKRRFKGKRGKGGVMTAYSKLVPGYRTTTTWSTGGSPPRTTSVTTVASLNAFLKDLSGILSVRGNHKTVNPHRYTVLKYNYGDGMVQNGNSLNGSIVTGTQAVNLGQTSTFTDASALCYNKALSRLYDQIRGGTDLSVDLAEAHKVKQMMTPRFGQARGVLLKSIPIAMNNAWKLASVMRRSNPRDWGNLWLEFTYGWKPLASSIYGALDNLVGMSRPNTGVTGLRVKSSAKEVAMNKINVTTVGNTVTSDVLFARNMARIKCFYAMNNGGLNSVATYTSLNPASIAWELVPYSFVVDWFVDIGGYMRNLESSLLYSSDFVSGYSQEITLQKEIKTQTGTNAGTSVAGSSRHEQIAYKRSILGSAPTPRGPGFNTHLGWQRLISAASLLGQQLHSLKHGKRIPANIWDPASNPFSPKGKSRWSKGKTRP